MRETMRWEDVLEMVRIIKRSDALENLSPERAHMVAVCMVAEMLAEAAEMSGGEFRTLLDRLNLELKTD